MYKPSKMGWFMALFYPHYIRFLGRANYFDPYPDESSKNPELAFGNRGCYVDVPGFPRDPHPEISRSAAHDPPHMRKKALRHIPIHFPIDFPSKIERWPAATRMGHSRQSPSSGPALGEPYFPLASLFTAKTFQMYKIYHI
jgi:hypothetical protein